MDKKLVAFTLIVVLLTLSLFSACGTGTISSTSTSSSTQTTTKSVTSTQFPTSTTTTTIQANWWDTFGEPEYGGTLTLSANRINNAFDPYNWMTASGNHYDLLWNPNWTEDRSSGTFSVRLWVPKYWEGNIAESWEWEDAKTLVVYLRQDVTWQDKAPMNGRQFTADDVVWHFDRMLGTGNGFTTVNPYFTGRFDGCKNVTSRDKFTVVFNFKNTAEFMNAVSIISEPQVQSFEAPEVWAMGQPTAEGSGINSALNEWQNVVGIGPYCVTDFVANSTMVESKNTNYWAYDERNPDNKLPYIDTIKTIFISDTSTSLAAFRTGKIDLLGNLSWQEADSMKETNPEAQYTSNPTMGGFVFMRCDKEPFTDINVRKAMQMALDLSAVAKGYFGSNVYWDGKPSGFTSPAFEGWAIPFVDWSKDLQEEYSYNPDKAKQLLTDAGYPNGFKTTSMAAGTSNLQLLQVLKAYWTDIGVDVTINAISDESTLEQMMMAKKHDPLSLRTSSIMPPQMGLSMFISTEPSNATVNADPVFDAKVAAIHSASSEEEAKNMVIDADMYMIENHWIINTVTVKNFKFWQPYIKGYSGEEQFNGGYARIWIDSALKKSMGR